MDMGVMAGPEREAERGVVLSRPLAPLRGHRKRGARGGGGGKAGGTETDGVKSERCCPAYGYIPRAPVEWFRLASEIDRQCQE